MHMETHPHTQMLAYVCVCMCMSGERKARCTDTNDRSVCRRQFGRRINKQTKPWKKRKAGAPRQLYNSVLLDIIRRIVVRFISFFSVFFFEVHIIAFYAY